MNESDFKSSLAAALISRSGNRFVVSSNDRSVSFYSVTEDYVEFYFVDPNRLAAGFNPIQINYDQLTFLIKTQDKRIFPGGVSVKVPHFYW